MHGQHAHPAVRNEKRRGTDSPHPDHSNRLWSEEEVALLKELDSKFKNHKYPNIEISKILTSKTAEQIKYKRKIIKTNMETSLQETTQETEGGCDLVNPFGDVDNNVEITTPYKNSDDSINEWRVEFRNAIETLTEVSHQRRDLYNRINAIWADNNKRESLIDEINNFIKTHLNGTLESYHEEEDNIEKDKGNNNTETRKANNGGKKITRNKRRRYKYARCQEIFKECPRKLADIIINNDITLLEPVKQTIKTEAIKEAFKNLWGTAGPSCVIDFTNNIDEHQIDEIFPPITDDEIEKEIRRMRNKAAVGSDGLQKKHLQIPSLSTVLGKMFNMIVFCSGFPNEWKTNRTTLIPKPGKGLSKVENWRPITIGPILGHLFSSVIDGRLRRIVKHNERQKGFTQHNGCKQNVEILNPAVKTCKIYDGRVFTIVQKRSILFLTKHWICV
jgi:hypothetical protein